MTNVDRLSTQIGQLSRVSPTNWPNRMRFVFFYRSADQSGNSSFSKFIIAGEDSRVKAELFYSVHVNRNRKQKGLTRPSLRFQVFLEDISKLSRNQKPLWT